MGAQENPGDPGREQSALVVGEVSTRHGCRRNARERALDSQSVLVGGGVMRRDRMVQQNKKGLFLEFWVPACTPPHDEPKKKMNEEFV